VKPADKTLSLLRHAQDLHLAKRYYDRAAVAQAAAWLPVKLALWALTAHSAWLQLAPALPRQLDWLKARVFQLSQPPPGAQARTCLVGKLMVSGFSCKPLPDYSAQIG